MRPVLSTTDTTKKQQPLGNEAIAGLKVLNSAPYICLFETGHFQERSTNAF
jgi:hypothetical protein